MNRAEGIKVGVIGPSDLVEAVCGIGHPMLELMPAVYDDESQAADLYRSLAPSVEVVLFTGPVPYHLVCTQVDVTLPVLYITLRGTGLYRALYHLRTDRLTVDTLSRRDVEAVFVELGLDPSHTNVYEGAATRRDLVAFHERQYREGLTVAALTCLRTAYRELNRRGIPCQWVTPTRIDIQDALEQARVLGESARNRYNQTVVGVVTIDHYSDWAGRAGSELEVQRRSLPVQSCLLRFAEECDGHLIAMGAGEWHFFTTRGSLERATENLTQARLVEEIHAACGTTASIGIGFALTASRAGTHARVALQHARRGGGNACYAVLDDKRLVGPIGTGNTLAYPLRTVEPALAALAETAGIPAPSLKRLISHLTRFQTFTAHEIAPVLGLSLRSAHRILARMEGAGVVEVVGQEKLLTPGRPRQVYKLTEKSLALSAT